jgi:DNA ligase-1
MLKDFQSLVNELQAENSSNGKKEILKRYPQCKKLLQLCLNPYKKFNLTSSQVKKHSDLGGRFLIENIFDLFENMVKGISSGYESIADINIFIKNNSQYEDMIYRILDKDLKCRTGATLVNKIYPGLIPEFKVALAEDYFKQGISVSTKYKSGKKKQVAEILHESLRIKPRHNKVDLASRMWLWSRKLDGVRCICRVENGEITFYSRVGHEFLTLGNLKSEMQKIYQLRDGVFDGEICLIDENGQENFQDVMCEIRRKDHTIKKPRYLIFDYLTLKEFDSGKSNPYDTLSARLIRSPIYNSEMIGAVKQESVLDEEHVVQLLNEAVEKGWEGLILRKDVPYEGKRTKNMLKVKKMNDEEYKIVAVNMGLIDDGQGNKVRGMVSVDIIHRGNRVGVGSGWNYAQRIQYEKHPEEILYKVITVKYFEETTNQYGEHSLRFPVVKSILGEKREV